jgi:hypothetical protein
MPMNRSWALLVAVVLVVGLAGASIALRDAPLVPVPHTTIATIPPAWLAYDPGLAALIEEVDEAELRRTTHDLQNFSTRVYPSAGNERAAGYLYERLAAIPGLEVAYRDDPYRNVVATLRGTDNSSRQVFVVGAHYDSISSDPERAPGAGDDACGAAIVLELARVMSGYRFDHTVQFAFWNVEEDDQLGSRAFVRSSVEEGTDIPLYFNYDTSCYDPEGRYVLDLVFTDEARPIADLSTAHNALYAIGFNLTFNQNGCKSDLLPFRRAGYPAIGTHSETHGPNDHTPNDTIDQVSFPYARKNARLGLLALARVAGVRSA